MYRQYFLGLLLLLQPVHRHLLVVFLLAIPKHRQYFHRQQGRGLVLLRPLPHLRVSTVALDALQFRLVVRHERAGDVGILLAQSAIFFLVNPQSRALL
jgi:hypothetical protein